MRNISLEQVEMRILCHLSKDENLKKVILSKGTDIHTATAALMFGVEVESILFKDPATHEKVKGPNYWMRDAAKSINFGLAYGRGAKSLSEQIGVSIGEARRLIDLYFRTYPGIHAWLNEAAWKARSNRYSLTPSNRIRWFSFNPSDHKEVSGVEREGKNSPIQGCNADIIKVALFRVHCRYPLGGPVKIANIIHDEINVEAPPEIADEVTQGVKEEMEIAGNSIIDSVPILADACHGSSWAIK